MDPPLPTQAATWLAPNYTGAGDPDIGEGEWLRALSYDAPIMECPWISEGSAQAASPTERAPAYLIAPGAVADVKRRVSKIDGPASRGLP